MSPLATKTTILPGFKNTKATPGGKLFDLPRELRDMIYTLLVEAGNLNILRTSRTLTEEAAEMVKKFGVYRINFYLYLFFGNPPQLEIDYYSPFRPTSKLPGMIQNVEIRLPSGYLFLHSANSDPIRCFGGHFPRNSFVFLLEYNSCVTIDEPIYSWPAFFAMRNLVGFQTLVVRILPAGTIQYRNIEFFLEIIRKALEPALGPGELHESGNIYLKFFPRQYHALLNSN